MSDTTTKPRILAVDDSRVMRVAIRKILGKDYDVIEAEHGEDAWTLLINDNTIQVMFTDLSMPYLDGYGLLERMRTSEDPRLQDMPVIIITGKEDDDNAKQQALDRGASDFISKPFESIQLQARAKAHVSFKATTTKLTDTAEKLERQAAIDETTGLAGQRYFCKAADDALAYIRRHGGQYVLVRMDLDDFNQIFIKNGKKAADTILSVIGQHLSKQVRKEDMLARVGLAKFAMLLRDTPMDKAEQLVQRILESMAGLKFNLSDTSNAVITVSLGVYEPDYKKEGDIKSQIEIAEKLLQQAAEKGRNQYVACSDLPDVIPVNLETALKHIQHDDTKVIENQTSGLAKRLFPILEYLARQFGDETVELVEKLKQKMLS
ncbi:MAG: diguanylate cyclase [Thioalkalispiraceae bacterium]